MAGPWTSPNPSDTRAAAAMLRRLTGSDIWEGFSTSEHPVGFYSHYQDRRSVPCFAPTLPCERCSRGESRRWRGYFSFYNVTVRKHHVCELTEGAHEQIQLAGYGTDLRPLRAAWLILSRHKGEDRGKLLVDFKPEKTPAFKLPPALDVASIIAKVYGFTP